MTYTEYAEFSSPENLIFIDMLRYVKVYDQINGFLGNFEVWHDSENENMEYITINNTKIYIDR